MSRSRYEVSVIQVINTFDHFLYILVEVEID